MFRLSRLLVLLSLAMGLAPLPVLAKEATHAWVADWATVIPAEEERVLAGALESYARRTGHEIVVATIADLQGKPIEAWGNSIGSSWGVARAGYNDGVVIIVAPRQRELQIVVGSGFANTLPKEVTDDILSRQMKPALQNAQWGAGLQAAALELMKAIDLKVPANRTASRMTYSTDTLGASGRPATSSPDASQEVSARTLAPIVLGVAFAALALTLLGYRYRRRSDTCPHCGLGGYCDYHQHHYGHHDHHAAGGFDPGGLNPGGFNPVGFNPGGPIPEARQMEGTFNGGGATS